MTRINLLSREIVARRKGRKWGLVAVVGIVALIFIFAVFHTSKVRECKRLKEEIAQIEQELLKFKGQKAELEEIKREKDGIIKRLTAIKQLIEKDRQLWSLLLEEMSKSIPEGVWLKRLSDQGEERLDISAVALDNFAVAQYMVNLIQNAYFEEVELKNLHKSSIGDYDVREFSLTCRYKREIGG